MDDQAQTILECLPFCSDRRPYSVVNSQQETEKSIVSPQEFLEGTESSREDFQASRLELVDVVQYYPINIEKSLVIRLDFYP
jgi:hypothetical protein